MLQKYKTARDYCYFYITINVMIICSREYASIGRCIKLYDGTMINRHRQSSAMAKSEM